MATVRMELPIEQAVFDATAPCGLVMVNSAAKLTFDDTTDETCYFRFLMPSNYVDTLKLIVLFTMDTDHAAAHKVEFEATWMAVTPADAQDVDTDSYDAVNRGNTTIPDDLGYLKECSITCTNEDGVAAHDWVKVKLSRDADGTGGNDDATGDCEVRGVALEYADA